MTDLTAFFQTAAGVFSLLNDYLISQGKAPLGFLNPLIYSTTSSPFNDITSGSNPGCGTQGFSAVHGWDPVRISLPKRPRNAVATATDGVATFCAMRICR